VRHPTFFFGSAIYLLFLALRKVTSPTSGRCPLGESMRGRMWARSCSAKDNNAEPLGWSSDPPNNSWVPARPELRGAFGQNHDGEALPGRAAGAQWFRRRGPVALAIRHPGWAGIDSHSLAADWCGIYGLKARRWG